MSIYEEGATASANLVEFIEKYGSIIDNVRRICVQTLAMAEKDRRKHDGDSIDGHCFVTQDEELKGQESMAYMILDELELEVDYWFCGTPILKDKESE